jgi:hypothetical protein
MAFMDVSYAAVGLGGGVVAGQGLVESGGVDIQRGLRLRSEVAYPAT